MHLLPIIAQLEILEAYERYTFISQLLTDWGVAYVEQPYKTGRNLFVQPTGKKPLLGICSHYDVVLGSPGANDNASAVAVYLAILQQL